MTRTYETFTIRWANGASWSGYDSADECQTALDFANRRGTIERHEFSIEVDADKAHLYRPGI